MFKLGVITDEISQDVERAAAVSKEMGLDCIELRGCWGKNIKDLTNAEVQRIKKIAKAAELQVICLASPFFKCTIANEAEVKEHLDFLPRLAEMTKLFDADIIRGFAFWSTENPAQHWEKAIMKLREAADICEDEGIMLALENEHATLVGTGREARMAVDAVGSKSLRIVWDAGNAFCAGEIPCPEGYLQVRGDTVHVHVKDAVRDMATGKIRFVAVGTGEIDYRSQFKALREDGYEGCVSIETHYRIQNDGEKSTRETCASLRGLLKTLNL